MDEYFKLRNKVHFTAFHIYFSSLNLFTQILKRNKNYKFMTKLIYNTKKIPRNLFNFFLLLFSALKLFCQTLIFKFYILRSVNCTC